MYEREGADVTKSNHGRPRHDPPLIRTQVKLTEEQMKLLRIWGRGCMAEGLRWLIDEAAKLVLKREKPGPPRNSE